MIVFVSYSRQDHDLGELQRIERYAASIGRPYIDDLYKHTAEDRQVTVHRALHAADFFVMVHSPHYLKTAWTRMEYWFAMTKKTPIAALMPDGILIGQSAPQWPWKWVDISLLGCTSTGQTPAKSNRCTIRPKSTVSDCPLCVNNCLGGHFAVGAGLDVSSSEAVFSDFK
jgi:hypothetical protein